MKCYTETTIGLKLYDMMDAQFSGNSRGSVCASIVDNEIFQDIDSWYMFWQITKRDRKGLFFIFTGNLNNDFYHRLSFGREIIYHWFFIWFSEYHAAHHSDQNTDA